jgi:[ribosomal protein S5]-alanine N-acetyltransferase
MDPRNAGSEKVAVKNGYKKEGLLRKVMFFNNEYHDNLLYAKLCENFQKSENEY